MLSMREIQISRGLKVKVDDEDFALVTKRHERSGVRRWTAVMARCGSFYAMSRRPKEAGGQMSSMAREILGLSVDDKREVDHINGDTLDNRRANLRVVTKEQNNMNRRKRKGCSSKYKGVSLDRDHGRALWKAYIGGKSTGGKRIILGRFKKERDAALAYNEAAKELFGQYAKLNVVPD